MRLTISRKLFLFFVLPGLIFFSFYITYSILNTEQINGYANLADTYLTETANNADYTANVVENFHNLTKKELFSLLEDNVTQSIIVFGSTIAIEPYVFNSNTKFYAPFVYKTANGIDSTIINSNYSSSNLDWYEVPKRTKKPYWTEPYFFSILKNIKLVSYCVPILRNGKFIGVATIDFSLEPLDHIFKTEFKHKSTQFVILAKSGKYISHPNAKKILESNIFDKNGKHFPLALRTRIGKSMTSGKTGFIKLIDPITVKFHKVVDAFDTYNQTPLTK